MIDQDLSKCRPVTHEEDIAYESIKQMFSSYIVNAECEEKHTSGDFLPIIKHEASALSIFTPRHYSRFVLSKLDSCVTLNSAKEYVDMYLSSISSTEKLVRFTKNGCKLSKNGNIFLKQSPILRLSYFEPQNENEKKLKDILLSDGSREQAILYMMCENSYLSNIANAEQSICSINNALMQKNWDILSEQNDFDKLAISCIKHDESIFREHNSKNSVGGIVSLSMLLSDKTDQKNR